MSGSPFVCELQQLCVASLLFRIYEMSCPCLMWLSSNKKNSVGVIRNYGQVIFIYLPRMVDKRLIWLSF